VLQRRGVLYPLRFIIPAVTSRSFCSSFSNHLFINARYHLDPVGRDSAPRRRGYPTLVATAQPIVCQNCLTFTSLVWRTCFRAHLVPSMALNALRLLSCFKRLIPHWRKILVPFNYLSVTLSEHRTSSLLGVVHYWRTLCRHKGSLVIASLASSHWQTKDAVIGSTFQLVMVDCQLFSKNIFLLSTCEISKIYYLLLQVVSSNKTQFLPQSPHRIIKFLGAAVPILRPPDQVRLIFFPLLSVLYADDLPFHMFFLLIFLNCPASVLISTPSYTIFVQHHRCYDFLVLVALGLFSYLYLHVS
jgi:hypothetical protein